MSIKEGGFTFKGTTTGYVVYYRRRSIGEIVTQKESNGRYCFRLGCDNRKRPRTYRGKTRAAEALKVIDALARQASKGRWSTETLIVQAWDSKPHTARNLSNGQG